MRSGEKGNPQFPHLLCSILRFFSEKGIVFLIFTLHSSLSNLKTSVNFVYGNTA